MVDATEEDGFEDYIETTKDPGSSLLVATILLTVLMNCLLPLLVRHGRRRQENKKKSESRQETDEEDSQNVSSEAGLDTLKIASKLAGVVNQTPSFAADDDGSVHSAHSKASSFVSSVLERPRSARRAALERRARDMDEGEAASVAEAASVSSQSVLGKLDADAVSTTDAVDAMDPAYFEQTPGLDAGPKKSVSERCSKSIDSLLVIAEWDYETKRIFKLALPYVSEAIATGISEAARVAIIAHFLGTREVTAYVSIDLFLGLTSSFLGGFMECMATLCSQAKGAGNRVLVGQYVQLAVGFFIAFNIPFIIFWLGVAEDLLLWLGFDEGIAEMGKDYAYWYLFIKFVDGIDNAVHELLDIIGYEVYSSIVHVTHEVVSAVAVLIAAIVGTPDLQTIGAIVFAVGMFFFVFNVIYVWYMRWCRKYYDGIFRTNAFRNTSAVLMLLKTSSALSLGWLLAYGEWEILTIFASFLGPAEVATWGLLGTLWDALELVTEAVADAAEVRCAYLMGYGKPHQAKLSAYKSIFLASVAALLMTSVVFIIGDDLPRILTKDPTLRGMLSELIPLFGIGNIALTIGTMAWTLVGSQGRYRLSTLVGFCGFWFVTLPLAAILGISLNVDLQGQAFAVVLGYMVSGTMNTYFLLVSDWKKLSDDVVAYNEVNDVYLSDEDE